MGSVESKVESPATPLPRSLRVETENTPSTPILTPTDPRSPSENVARTPLDVILTGEVDEPGGIETQDAGSILGIDPRSPTVDFDRTPIIVAARPKTRKLHNKNFEHVLAAELGTPKCIPFEKTKIQITEDVTRERRVSCLGLLETNIDYTETNLDSVIQATNITLPVALKEPLVSNQLENQMEVLECDNDEVLNCEKPEKSPLVLEIFEESPHDTDKTVNITEQVKDFDEKLTNLIYQDEVANNDKNPVVKAKIKDGVRTPLGARSNNQDSKKSAKLKVSDKPKKGRKSKIPVYHELKKNFGQCENTPPRKMNGKSSQWDNEKTMII